MAASKRLVRTVVFVLAACLPAAFSLPGCGGGDGGSGGPTAGGSSAIGLSVASAPSFPTGTTFASVESTRPSGVDAAAAPEPEFDNVLVTVRRIALIPAATPEYPDAEGEIEAPDDPDELIPGGRKGFVTLPLPAPVTIDLLHPPSAIRAARLLNRFAGVPPGEYAKIRVHYDNVVGIRGGEATDFHPTAKHHFDVHFVGGNLRIPLSPSSDEGIRFHSLSIRIVGLKYHRAGTSGNVLLRPQLFATVDPPKYLVSGTARNVDPLSGTLDIVTEADRAVPAAWDVGTGWMFEDGRFAALPASLAEAALRDGARVEAVGLFLSGVLSADELSIGFPASRSGVADPAGWRADDTFVLSSGGDNVVVLPMPGRTLAFYDGIAFPHAVLDDSAVTGDARVVARGYPVPGGIEAFWISVGTP